MAPLDPTTQLSIAELAIYIVLVPVIIYILIRHGKSGYLGWGFLIVFCGLRLAADGIQISNHNKAAKGEPVGNAGAIVNAIGISGLLYSLLDIIHECYCRIANYNRQLSSIIQLVLHLLITIGIVLSAYGGAHLGKPESAKNNHAKDNTIRKVGSLLLFLTAMLLIVSAFHTYRRLKALPSSLLNHNAIGLLYFTMFALPFTAIRATYGIIYSFDHSSTVNPVTGAFAIKLVLIFLVQLLAVLALVIGGIMTRNIRMEDESISSGSKHTRATSSEPISGPSLRDLSWMSMALYRDSTRKRLGTEFRRGV